MAESSDPEGLKTQVVPNKETTDCKVTSEESCTLKECKKDIDQYMLQCTTCSHLTHYGCTSLPAYQVSLFMQSGYRKYKCRKCVGEVDENILKCCTSGLTKYKSKTKKLLEEKVTLVNDNITKEGELERANNDKLKLKSEIGILKENLASLQEQFEILKKSKASGDERLEALTKEGSQKQDVGTHMPANETKDQPGLELSTLAEFKSELLSSVSKIVDNKLSVLNEKIESVIQIPDEINNKCTLSFKQVLDKNIKSTATSTDFKKIMIDSKNNELVQEKERKLRAANVIIHGVPDIDENTKEHDVKYIEQFLNVLGIHEQPTSIIRLGTSS